MTNDIKIPRELAERLLNPTSLYEAEDELRALLAAPVVESQEPVAYCYREHVWATGLCDYVWRDKLEAEKPGDDSEIKDLAPLYPSPSAPVAVAVVLPERKPMPDQATFVGGNTYFCKMFDEARGYNQALDDVQARLDKVKELNK